MARTDAQRGVWKAPASLDATLSSVRELSVKLTDGENGRLNPLGGRFGGNPSRISKGENPMAQFTVNPTRFDPFKNFKFRVLSDGKYVAAVSKVSALNGTTELVEHREGNADLIKKGGAAVDSFDWGNGWIDADGLRAADQTGWVYANGLWADGAMTTLADAWDWVYARGISPDLSDDDTGFDTASTTTTRGLTTVPGSPGRYGLDNDPGPGISPTTDWTDPECDAGSLVHGDGPATTAARVGVPNMMGD
jgi:hypothetical protein